MCTKKHEPPTFDPQIRKIDQAVYADRHVKNVPFLSNIAQPRPLIRFPPFLGKNARGSMIAYTSNLDLEIMPLTALDPHNANDTHTDIHF